MKKISITLLVCSALLLSACSKNNESAQADSEEKSNTSTKFSSTNNFKAKKLAEEKKKQDKTAQKIREADEAMKQAEANLTDESIENASKAIDAIPGGNNDLSKRLETSRAKLNEIKEQAAAAEAQQAQQQQHVQDQVQNDADGNGIPDDSPYNNTTPEERAKGAQMEADAQRRYWEAYNNGASPDDALAYADGRSDSYAQQQNDAAAELDQYCSNFKAQNGREPTSGEIQSQWLKDQGLE